MTLAIELLQVALGQRECLRCVPTAAEWNDIYRFATDQALAGVLFAGVERLPKHQRPARVLLMTWAAGTEYLKKLNSQVDADCQKISAVFGEAGFRHCIMKGQGNALLYGGLAALRTAGDIDIWVDGGFAKVNAFVQKLSPTREINELEIQLRGVCKTPVEVHYRPFIMRNPWYNRRLQAFFAAEADSCFGSPDGFTTIRFNIIHQLAHIRLHLFTEGIGMRQLVDYYFVLLQSKEDPAEMMSIAGRLGMTDFAAAMMWVMKEVMLLPDEHLLCRPDAAGGRLLLGEVLRSGNFGRADSALQAFKSSRLYSPWALLIRNLRYWRFDSWDWICGPMWRIYHNAWRLIKGYK